MKLEHVFHVVQKISQDGIMLIKYVNNVQLIFQSLIVRIIHVNHAL
jgi:hypothetical protein